MARSGMGVDENCKAVFAELQRRKAHPYIVFRIDERRKQIVVDAVGKKGDTYDDFLACLPEADCRYAVYDFDFVTRDNCSKSKIFFISWSPDVSRVRSKFLYATSKDRFRKELDGVHYEVQATDPTEIEIGVMEERAH